MNTDLYSFAFRGLLAEEALDVAGRKRYFTEEAFFSEDLAKKLHFTETNSKYVEQSKTMLTVFELLPLLKMRPESLFIQHLRERMLLSGGIKEFKIAYGRKRNREKTQRLKLSGTFTEETL